MLCWLGLVREELAGVEEAGELECDGQEVRDSRLFSRTRKEFLIRIHDFVWPFDFVFKS